MTASDNVLTEHHEIVRELSCPIESYSIECDGVPVHQSIELIGPASGVRIQRRWHPDFFSISELGKSLVHSQMSDMERALAVYRFSSRYTYLMSIGFGSTEMTRFLNCFGYSFCWGQADFQHLLFEAVGLRVRSPRLIGHSSCEVLIDNRWTTWDAFTRNLHPAPDLVGLATGADLRAHPEIIETVFPPDVAAQLNGYWAGAEAGTDSYEPWQDSRAMLLNLRRGESMRLDLNRRDHWCLAPIEPRDYTNGTWTWQPLMDTEHVAQEASLASGVEAGPGGLVASGDGEMEYCIRSPYALVIGELSIALSDGACPSVRASRDGRRTWSALVQEGEAWRFTADQLSARTLPYSSAPADLPHGAVYEVIVHISWSAATLMQLAFRFELQAHARSLPPLESGTTDWRIIGGDHGATVIHRYQSSPAFRASCYDPLMDDPVTLSVDYLNHSKRDVTGASLRIYQPGVDVEIGRVDDLQLTAGQTTTTSITWRATAHPDRPLGVPKKKQFYVNTPLVAQILDREGAVIAQAETVLTVRPRPWPCIEPAYTICELTDHGYEVRVAVANMPPEFVGKRPHVYVVDTPLSVIVELWDGHPEARSRMLEGPELLKGIQPAEFAVATWTLDASIRADQRDLYAKIECYDTVEADSRFLLVPIRMA